MNVHGLVSTEREQSDSIEMNRTDSRFYEPVLLSDCLRNWFGSRKEVCDGTVTQKRIPFIQKVCCYTLIILRFHIKMK